MSFCRCVVNTWKNNDSDPYCLLVHVLCLYLGCKINPFVLVLHFKIKLF